MNGMQTIKVEESNARPADVMPATITLYGETYTVELNEGLRWTPAFFTGKRKGHYSIGKTTGLYHGATVYVITSGSRCQVHGHFYIKDGEFKALIKA